MAVPVNKALYARVKAQAKKKFKVWPSAYGSAWLVRTYKKRGGKYRSGSRKPSRRRRSGSRPRRRSRSRPRRQRRSRPRRRSRSRPRRRRRRSGSRQRRRRRSRR